MLELKIRTAPVISPSAILVSIHFFNFRLSLITGALPVTACMFSIMIGCIGNQIHLSAAGYGIPQLWLNPGALHVNDTMRYLIMITTPMYNKELPSAEIA